MSLVRKLLLKVDGRSGRLVDFRGNRIPLIYLLLHGPQAVLTGFLRLTLGYLPKRPWISYAGQAQINQFLDKSKRVLEFGSGLSTRWYAQRASYVLSLEDNRDWYNRTHAELVALGNVEHRFCASLEAYKLAGEAQDKKFDFIMIDGTQRFECLRSALPRLAPGGMLYLDNSDMLGDHVTGDIPKARALMHEYALRNGKRIETFTDFAPTQLFVNEATILYN